MVFFTYIGGEGVNKLRHVLVGWKRTATGLLVSLMSINPNLLSTIISLSIFTATNNASRSSIQRVDKRRGAMKEINKTKKVLSEIIKEPGKQIR